MKDFVIVTDSAADMPREYYEKENVVVMPLSYIMNGETYKDGEGLSSKDYFDAIRNGAMPTTSQVNPEEAIETFEKILAEGKDVLYVGFSSGLSGSYNSGRIAAEELSEKYPDAKIKAVDTLCAAMGEGIMLYKVVELKKQGKTIDECVAYIEENKLNVCHLFTVDDLNHLHRGGRVSKATAVIGTMVNIKPILHVNEEGKLVSLSKARGRKKSLTELVNIMEEKCKGFEADNEQIIAINHGDCEEDAIFVQDLIKSRLGLENCIINSLGAVLGAHTGPGLIALFFMGNAR